MKMKAAVYYGPGDIRLEEIERPTAGTEGVVVKVRACGVCPIIDLGAWKIWSVRGTGLALGHEFVGDVVELGDKVTAVKKGDRVYGLSFRPCHTCDWCRIGSYWRCNNWMAGMKGKHGAFAEYFWFPFATEENIVKLPDNLSYHELAFIEPLSLSIGLSRKAKDGDVVIVIGQHLVGLGTVACLKEQGIAKVITSDISQKRLEASRELGADVIVDTVNEDIAKVVMKETAGEGADLVIVSDESPGSLLQAIGSVRRGGDIWLANSFTLGDKLGSWAGPGGLVSGPIPAALPISASIQTSWGTLGPRAPRFLEAMGLIDSGKITAKKHVTHVFPLDKIKEAFEIANNPHESIEVIVEP
ncbi:zinc-binding dehydrogenase [Chloroflexota bacterium]